MSRAVYPSDERDQYMVRFPDGLRDEIKAASEANLRSMNSEIIHRLLAFDPAKSLTVSVFHEAKGPAETAISPDHGPTTPTTETAMDAASNITAPGRPAIPFDYESAFAGLENPINDVLNIGNVLDALIDAADRPSARRTDSVVVPEDLFNAISYTVRTLRMATKALDELHLELHNRGVNLEHERAKAVAHSANVSSGGISR